jgi:hypothetical protein
VLSHGSEGSIARESPKSVSLISGASGAGSAGKCAVRRTSARRRQGHRRRARRAARTLELDVAVYDVALVQPRNDADELGPHAVERALGELRVRTVVVDKVE